MTGIGGQGVQLAATVLAQAAVAEGRTVQLFGSYGGMMRGGNTEATVVVADGPVESPPTVSAAWSAIVMHHEFSEPRPAGLGPGGVALVNSTVFEPRVGGRGRAGGARLGTVVEIPAAAIALELGNVMAASMVMVGAYVAVTGLVGHARPPRARRATRSPPTGPSTSSSTNGRCDAGYERRAPPDIAPAWTTDASAVPT